MKNIRWMVLVGAVTSSIGCGGGAGDAGGGVSSVGQALEAQTFNAVYTATITSVDTTAMGWGKGCGPRTDHGSRRRSYIGDVAA